MYVASTIGKKVERMKVKKFAEKKGQKQKSHPNHSQTNAQDKKFVMYYEC